MVLYGMPAFDERLEARIDAGDVVLNGCCIEVDEPMYPYECQECGHRFDGDMAKRPSAKAYFSAEDYAWIESIASTYERTEQEDRKIPADDDALVGACVQLAQDILDDDPEGFECDLELNYANAYRWYAAPMFSRLVMLGLEYGVACEDGACANWLGAMYYMGDIVEQDYAKAKELYELAERGLRIDIARGQTYYKKRLQEALEGQERMREADDYLGIRVHLQAKHEQISSPLTVDVTTEDRIPHDVFSSSKNTARTGRL